MEREHRDLDRETEEEREEQPDLELRGHPGGDRRQLLDRKRGRLAEPLVTEEAGRVVEVERDDAEQHQHRSREGIEEELDRGVQPPVTSPDSDQEIHRDEHDLPEDIEQEEVERAESPDHERLQKKEQDVVLLLPGRDRRVGAGDRDDANESGQEDQQERNPVDAEVVVHAERWNPRELLDELIALPPPLEEEPQRQRDDEIHEHDHRRDRLDGAGPLLGHEKHDRERPGERDVGHDREDRDPDAHQMHAVVLIGKSDTPRRYKRARPPSRGRSSERVPSAPGAEGGTLPAESRRRR